MSCSCHVVVGANYRLVHTGWLPCYHRRDASKLSELKDVTGRERLESLLKLQHESNASAHLNIRLLLISLLT